MGREEGGALARRARQLAPIAALAGAAAAGAAAAWRQRRRPAAVSPDASLAGPPSDRPRVAPTTRRRAAAGVQTSAPSANGGPPPVAALVAALAPVLEPATEVALAPPAEPTADRPPLTHRGNADATPAAETSPPASTTPPVTRPDPPAHPAPTGAPAPWRVERRFEPAAAAPLLRDAASPDENTPAVAPDRPSEAAPEPAAAALAASPPPPAPAPTPAPAPPTPSPTPAPPTAPPTPALPTARPAPEGRPAAAPAPQTDEPRRPGLVARQLAGVRRHRVRLVAGLAVVALGVGASAALAGVGGEDEPRSGDAVTAPGPTDTTEPPATTSTTRPLVTTDEAFTVAAERLSTAGTFSYRGSARATDVSLVRPMMWLAVESSVTGEVELATGRLHEVAVGADGRGSETVTQGTVVWGRRASREASLDAEPYALVPELSDPDRLGGRGLVMLPTWLAAATGPVEVETMPGEPTQYQATVPADVVGEVERGIEAEDLVALLTIDRDGTPLRIELTTAASDRLHLVLELTGVGEPVAIAPPTPPPA